MASVLEHLQPNNLWKNFELICSIPHPSKHEKKLADRIIAFGKSLNLETLTDATGNILIRKPATKGMENKKSIALQAHIDMVPQKNTATKHDFLNDPIIPRVVGNLVKATGTTLGADNGIGVAAIMAILQSTDIAHGPIEALLTIDEETGMTGAFNIEPQWLQSSIMLNLDSEDEGELCVGCAGGLNANISFPFTNEKTPSGYKAFALQLTGLKGGHSGVDIHRQRGNANKLMIRFLYHAALKHGLLLSSINGGSLRNAIPREAFAVVLVPIQETDAFLEALEDFEYLYTVELAVVESAISFKADETTVPPTFIDKVSQDKLFKAIYACPNGVIRMNDNMPGLVETSNNIAIVKSSGSLFEIKCLLRSSIEISKHDLAITIESVFSLINAAIRFDGDYPGWNPNMQSAILKTSKDVYTKLYGNEPHINAVHAGLECGIIGATYSTMDMISFGPTIRFPHSPDEYVEIDSVEKFWKFLVAVLEAAPEND